MTSPMQTPSTRESEIAEALDSSEAMGALGCFVLLALSAAILLAFGLKASNTEAPWLREVAAAWSVFELVVAGTLLAGRHWRLLSRRAERHVIVANGVITIVASAAAYRFASLWLTEVATHFPLVSSAVGHAPGRMITGALSIRDFLLFAHLGMVSVGTSVLIGSVAHRGLFATIATLVTLVATSGSVEGFTVTVQTGAFALAGFAIAAARADLVGRAAAAEHDHKVLEAQRASYLAAQEMELARELQASLTPPRFWKFGGATVAQSFQTMHEKVGGDWMGIATGSEGQVHLVVADVTGKGFKAAVVAQAIHSIWHNEIRGPHFDPETFLHRLHSTLRFMGGGMQTATVGIATIRLPTITYWSAGHCPLYVLQPHRKEHRTLLASGSIAGSDEDMQLFPKKLDLEEPWDFDLLIGSDGIFDGLPRRRSAVTLFVDELRAAGLQAIERLPTNDDKTLIWVEGRVQRPLGELEP